MLVIRPPEQPQIQVTLARKRLADSLLNQYLPLYFPEMARLG
jgi:hypothetical protein